MYTLLVFITKQPHLTTAAFIDHYETKHVPLVISLSGDKLPLSYKRRYADHEGGPAKRSAAKGTPIDWDVSTELVFADEAGFAAWMAEISKDGRWAKIREDEDRFLERDKIRMVTVTEYVTDLGSGGISKSTST